MSNLRADGNIQAVIKNFFQGLNRRQWFVLSFSLVSILLIGIGTLVIVVLLRQELANFRNNTGPEAETIMVAADDLSKKAMGWPLEKRIELELEKLAEKENLSVEELRKLAPRTKLLLGDKYDELRRLIVTGTASEIGSAAAEAYADALKAYADAPTLSGEDRKQNRKKWMTIGAALNSTNQPDKALESFRKAQSYALRDTEPIEWAEATSEIVGCLIADWRLLEAEGLMRKMMPILESEPATKPEDRRLMRQVFAFILNFLGRYDEAAQYREAPTAENVSMAAAMKAMWTKPPRSPTAARMDALSDVLATVNGFFASRGDPAAIGKTLTALAMDVREFSRRQPKKEQMPPYALKFLGAVALGAGGQVDACVQILQFVRADIAADKASPKVLGLVIDSLIGAILMETRPDDAEFYFRKVVAEGANAPNGGMWILLDRLCRGVMLLQGEKWATAESEFRSARQGLLERMGAKSFFTTIATSGLAQVLVRRDCRPEAETLLRELAAQPESLQFLNEMKAVELDRLGMLLLKDGRPTEAREVFQEGLLLLARRQMADPLRHAAFYAGLAGAANDEKNFETAVRIADEALPKLAALGDRSSFDFRLLITRKAFALQRLKRYSEAIAATRSLIAVVQTLKPPQPKALLDAQYDLAWYLYLAGAYPESEKLYRQLFSDAVARGERASRIADMKRELADVLVATKHFEEAEHVVREAIAILQAWERNGHPVNAWPRYEESFLNVRQARGQKPDAALAEWKQLREDAAGTPAK